MALATNPKISFLMQVQRKYPALFNAAVHRARNMHGLSGLGETTAEMIAAQDAFGEPDSTSWLTSATNSLLDTIKQLAPAYVGVQQAKTCLQINAERAKQNLPPIDCASSGMSPQVSVGVSPDVKYIMYGALGIGAAYLLLRSKRR